MNDSNGSGHGAGNDAGPGGRPPDGRERLTTFETIDLRVADAVATVTLNRPEKLNATTDRMLDELTAAIDSIEADDAVRVAVFTGAGRAYCAGADLTPGVGLVGGRRRVDRDRGGEIALRLFDLTKTTIAAVNGPAFGFGATMLLPMDIRLASPAARFGFVFSRLGIAPEAGSSWFLPRVVGISTAVEWVSRGQVVDAELAHARGLVSAVHPPDELLPAATELAREIARSTSPVAAAAARRMLWAMLAADHPRHAVRLGIEVNRELMEGPDAQEGMRAAVERRAPVFSSRSPGGLPAALRDRAASGADRGPEATGPPV